MPDDTAPVAAVTSPSVSVVIPTFNRAPLLRRALASVLPQCRPGDEVIVVDDGSTDDTGLVVRDAGDAVRCLRTARAGAGGARNAGIAAARGDLVAFLDSDDEWVPGKLGWQRAVMAWRPDVLFVFSDFGAAMSNGDRIHHHISAWHADPRPWDEILGPGAPSGSVPDLPADAPPFRLHVGDLYPTFLRHWSVFAGTVVVRREAAGDALRFGEGLPTFEDVECFARLAGRGPAAYMDCETAWQHQHPGSRLTDADSTVRARTALTVLARVYGGDGTFLAAHRAEYESVMDGHRAVVVRALLAEGRVSAARDELARMFHPHPSLAVMCGLGPVVPTVLAARRGLRRLFAFGRQ